MNQETQGQDNPLNNFLREQNKDQEEQWLSDNSGHASHGSAQNSDIDNLLRDVIQEHGDKNDTDEYTKVKKKNNDHDGVKPQDWWRPYAQAKGIQIDTFYVVESVTFRQIKTDFMA